MKIYPLGFPFNISGSYRMSDEQLEKTKAILGAEEVLTIRKGETPLHKFLSRKTLDRMGDIARFNQEMSGNPGKIIRFHNRIIEQERQKHELIETFTNQLYAYFLRRKQGEEYN